MTSPFPRLIGIHAPVPGSGKTTIANYLVEQYKYHRIPFADPLKLMMKTLLQCFGYSTACGDKLLNDPTLKEKILPKLGVTPRYMMQTLGTEWGRKLINPEIWLFAWKQSVEELGVYGNVVVDDVRFPNELGIVKSMPDSALWWVERPNIPITASVMAHSSQQPLDQFQFDEVFLNNGTLKELYANVDDTLKGVHR